MAWRQLFSWQLSRRFSVWDVVEYARRHMELVGVSKRGDVDVSFSKIKEVFGEPTTEGEDEKVGAEWVVEFLDEGDIICIYCYRRGPKLDGTPLENIGTWEIGGKGKHPRALIQHIKEMLGVI